MQSALARRPQAASLRPSTPLAVAACFADTFSEKARSPGKRESHIRRTRLARRHDISHSDSCSLSLSLSASSDRVSRSRRRAPGCTDPLHWAQSVFSVKSMEAWSKSEPRGSWKRGRASPAARTLSCPGRAPPQPPPHLQPRFLMRKPCSSSSRITILRSVIPWLPVSVRGAGFSRRSSRRSAALPTASAKSSLPSTLQP